MNEDIQKKRWKILSVTVLGAFMSTIDSSIVNVALPVMSKDLNVGLDSIQWIVTSYLIVISALIVMFGKIADKKGKSKIFLDGFIVFGTGSILCSISNNLSFLIFARVFQAVGASMFMSSNQGIIAAVFPANERGRALGLSGTTVALGTMIGPAIGGIMVQFFNWQSIFLINVPIAFIGFVIGKRIFPKKEVLEQSEKFDFLGSSFFMIFIVALFWAILSGEDLGWGNLSILISFTLSLISFFIFVYAEKKSQNPMIDFSMFKNNLFNVSLICGFISFLAMFGMNIIQPFYLQYIIKVSPAVSGLFMIVSPMFLAVIAPISGYISDKVGSEIITFLGLISMAAGFVFMAFLNEKSTYMDIILRAALVGIGNGLFQSPNNSIIMSCVSKDKLGIAGSINALIRNIGMVSGIAFSVVLLYARMSSKLGYKVVSYMGGHGSAFIYGMSAVYIFSACACLIGVLLTAFRIFKRKSGKVII